MKKWATRFVIISLAFVMLCSCKVWHNVFGPKYGCPGNGKNVGAERVLSGERTPKPKKFKS